ncbi:hypothetical protein GCM10011391_11290 [Pullulanibacillus camelliae]|uniref:Isoprenylcysteine carboxyl methyltransferase n=1 Tax=Pullulanibacillus camelliae TaxID=1707096 RepID=A0A8J2VNP6_9BACL|nr:isoprenylcysteine carboxylmethyltransferase family protein [Pullulanibacillus camelliae]GGE34337.1 hypothetical protein GCM10011391_11290 [Pullulanibacillus camelliae]
MRAFLIVVGFVITQRLIELILAKRNERLLKKRGAIEIGAEHYKWLILLHIMFFLSLCGEVLMIRPTFFYWSVVPALFFLSAQCVRLWALLALGDYWNTKIIILPGAQAVNKGPYRLMRHPNYLVVAIEIFALPLLFQAYFTMVVFTLLNAAILLKVRLPDEEEALLQLADYKEKMAYKPRFMPHTDRK